MTDWQQALLGMMAGGQQGADAHATLMQSLSEREDLDPWTRALLSRAVTPSADAEQTVADDDDTAGADDDARDDDDEDAWDEDEIRRQRALRRLRRRFVDMQLELERLRARNDRFAAAL